MQFQPKTIIAVGSPVGKARATGALFGRQRKSRVQSEKYSLLRSLRLKPLLPLAGIHESLLGRYCSHYLTQYIYMNTSQDPQRGRDDSMDSENSYARCQHILMSRTGVSLIASSPSTTSTVPSTLTSRTSCMPIGESRSGVRDAKTPTSFPSSPRLNRDRTQRALCK